MCSVTFWPRRGGYLLAMNRDEMLSRITGLAPERMVIGARTVLHPREPGGGTWISVNDLGVGIALINWYAISAQATPPTVSRGDVVRTIRDCGDMDEAAGRLEQLPLQRMNPFRLMGIFPWESTVGEWRWDLHDLVHVRHDWSPGQWLSSGHDEAGAQRIRSATFNLMRTETDAGSLPWLRRLHASHGPERGPYSTCMHRADAATVSYTEVEVAGPSVVMRHHQGPPCGARDFVSEWIPRVIGSVRRV